MRRRSRAWWWAGGDNDLSTFPASRLLLHDLEPPRHRASPPRACCSATQSRRVVVPLLLDLQHRRWMRYRKVGGENLARRSRFRSTAGWSSKSPVKGCWTRKGAATSPPHAARRLPASRACPPRPKPAPASRYPFPSSRLQSHGGSQPD
jgi:hypothetical protein